MKIELLDNLYVEDNKFNQNKAYAFAGRAAGICYNKDGYSALLDEDLSKTLKRAESTLVTGHHSVYDHIHLSFYFKNMPKILTMILNNEKMYTTSEKSGRYTNMTSDALSKLEIDLYNKWLNILKKEIKDKYGYYYKDFKINTLAQENARYLINIFMPTELIYTTSLRQINLIAAMLYEYCMNNNTELSNQLIPYIHDFIDQLHNLKVLDEKLMINEKERKLSIFNNQNNITEYFNNNYQVKYEGSFIYYAQAHRHRTINYSLNEKPEKSYIIPPIIEDKDYLLNEWLNDLNKLNDLIIQGELIDIVEHGSYENFILKTKERLCTYTQLETMLITKEILNKYNEELHKTNHPLKDDIVNYLKGARCTFPDYTCLDRCNFKEGITLVRKI